MSPRTGRGSSISNGKSFLGIRPRLEVRVGRVACTSLRLAVPFGRTTPGVLMDVVLGETIAEGRYDEDGVTSATGSFQFGSRS